MEASGRTSSLFRHDGQIAINTVRAAFAAWRDRLMAGIVLLIALTGVRSWFGDRAWTTAAWAAVAVSLMIGIAAGRLAVVRLAFHGSDGVLAAEALHAPARRRYQARWLGIGLAMLSGITLIVRPSLLIGSAPAYLVGALIAELTDGVGIPLRVTRWTRPGWSVRAWLRQPAAGIAAAMVLFFALLEARTLGPNGMVACAGVGAGLLALVLTLVDAGAVRFMTIAGYGSGRILLRLSRALAWFVLVAAPMCWLTFGPASAGIVAVAAAGMLLLLAVRILAYRLHGKRFADLLVVFLIGLLMLVGYAVPVALPVVAIGVLWHLQRRAAAKTWLLA
jgi:hypothetical protein